MYKVTLEAARVNAGLSQKEAAEQIDVHVATISHWERGKTYPDMDKFKALCDLYGCSCDQIFLKSGLT